ncbi:MAG: nucleoside-diphosphate sugar epimerase/dehydratase [Rhodocyclaceae bacterium]|nr:nucleoside-diphosphate sugar epimerase/dehydratase [Rhodocyclaceae bacterium]
MIPHLFSFAYYLSELPRRSKQLVMLACDVFVIELSLWSAFSLRLEQFYMPVGGAITLFALAPLLAVPAFLRFGLYHAIIRYLGFQTLMAIAQAVMLHVVLLALLLYVMVLPDVPRSVIFIHGLILLVIIGTSRLLARYGLRNMHLSCGRSARGRGGFGDQSDRRNVAIYGAGDAGVQLATALTTSRELKPVVLIDDDPALRGQHIGGLAVFLPQELPNLIERFNIHEVLLAMPSASRTRRNEVMRMLESFPVHVRTLPGIAEIAQGKIKTDYLREVEIEDLLGRDPVPPHPSLLGRNITGLSVMVTGAGGSIGSELCRQIVALRPSRLVLFEQSEVALYHIEQELLGSDVEIVAVLGSVTDQSRMERSLETFGVRTVFHAAAYKHVPMVEKNPCQGVINNILGTWHAARAALNQGVDTFVLISTDKAVRPTNIMGATKRFAELILQAMARQFPNQTRFTMVRFGNVLGSSGSVVPLFRRQIRAGGPVTVTDPRIIRYFMTIPEAAQLVIQAGAMGSDGDVFVLDMGEPVKILDLAERMIRLSGLTPKEEGAEEGDIDIDIVFTGLRPGEKMYEELLLGDNVTPTEHPRIQRANEQCLTWPDIEHRIEQLRQAVAQDDEADVQAILLATVEGFTTRRRVQ